MLFLPIQLNVLHEPENDITCSNHAYAQLSDTVVIDLAMQVVYCKGKHQERIFNFCGCLLRGYVLVLMMLGRKLVKTAKSELTNS